VTTANETPTGANFYRDNVCWHGVKGPRGDNRPCGLDARKYMVRRPDNGTLTQPRWAELTVWLCAAHKQALTERGYICTLIP
jgi:hypothetical protein